MSMNVKKGPTTVMLMLSAQTLKAATPVPAMMAIVVMERAAQVYISLIKVQSVPLHDIVLNASELIIKSLS